MNTTDKPLAAHGFTSYRYKGQFGYVMIGATDVNDALYEAARSTVNVTVVNVTVDNLEIWDESTKRYAPVKEAVANA